MYLTIPFNIKDAIGDALLEKGHDAEASKFHERQYAGDRDKINIHLKTQITSDFLEDLIVIADTLKLRGLKVQANQSLLLINDPASEKIKTLKSFEVAVTNYIQNNALKGWLFSLDSAGQYLPYIVSSIWFSPAKPDGRESTVQLSLGANSPKQSSRNSGSKINLTFNLESVRGISVPEALAEIGFYKENQDLIDEYDRTSESYLKFQPMYGKQFIGHGKISTEKNYRTVNIPLDGKKRIKMVNDDNKEESARIFSTYTSFDFWEQRNAPEGVFEEVPFHPYIKMFDLAGHTDLWVLARQLEPYTYNPSLGDKLILPDEHHDLIQILVNDMDVVVDDIVEGKSGGTSILCMGSPGLGKTLTAEIYSEVVGRPLYRVHSGQLGTDPEKIEERLGLILDRTESWGSILLLDEADVYIRSRDNSMIHNAIVAAFLRKLEYFSGLLFMTTNRSEDVDDAIKSRCMAILKYKLPPPKNAKLIWKTLSTEFKMDISDSVIDELVTEYPECNGRDIKELLKLAKKYNTIKARPLNKETFRQCAVFRGIEHRT
jgi:hypothetical protein